MADFVTLFRAETKRYFAVQWSHMGDTLSWFLYFFLMLGAAVILISGVRGGDFGVTGGLLMAAGWLTWMVASDCMAELPHSISEEAKNGTLEQICITPVPLAKILMVRSLAYFLGIGARGIVAALVLVVFIAPMSLSPAILLIFFISLFGAYGMGFMFAGLALIFKRVKSLTNLVFSLMIFFTGSLVGLESTGVVFDILKFVFPLTWGISLMRQLLSGLSSLSILIDNREIQGIVFHSVIYLFLGLLVFLYGYQRSKRDGTLGHY